jgi:hypothetical protein
LVAVHRHDANGAFRRRSASRDFFRTTSFARRSPADSAASHDRSSAAAADDRRDCNPMTLGARESAINDA